jgi:hypothetical protein
MHLSPSTVSVPSHAGTAAGMNCATLQQDRREHVSCWRVAGDRRPLSSGASRYRQSGGLRSPLESYQLLGYRRTANQL